MLRTARLAALCLYGTLAHPASDGRASRFGDTLLLGVRRGLLGLSRINLAPGPGAGLPGGAPRFSFGSPEPKSERARRARRARASSITSSIFMGLSRRANARAHRCEARITKSTAHARKMFLLPSRFPLPLCSFYFVRGEGGRGWYFFFSLDFPPCVVPPSPF